MAIKNDLIVIRVTAKEKLEILAEAKVWATENQWKRMRGREHFESTSRYLLGLHRARLEGTQPQLQIVTYDGPKPHL